MNYGQPHYVSDIAGYFEVEKWGYLLFKRFYQYPLISYLSLEKLSKTGYLIG